VPIKFAKTQGHRSPGGELGRVRQEIEQDLAQARRIGAHIERVEGIGDVEDDRIAVVVGPAANDADGGLRQGADVDGTLLELELAVLDLGIVEDLVDDFQQRLAGGANGLDAGQRIFRKLGEFEELRHAENGVERRADLVAHRRHELRLGAVAGIRRLVGFRQALGHALEFKPRLAHRLQLPAQGDDKEHDRDHEQGQHDRRSLLEVENGGARIGPFGAQLHIGLNEEVFGQLDQARQRKVELFQFGGIRNGALGVAVKSRLDSGNRRLDLAEQAQDLGILGEIAAELRFLHHLHARMENVIAQREFVDEDLARRLTAQVGEAVVKGARLAIQLVDRPHGVLANAVLEESELA